MENDDQGLDVVKKDCPNQPQEPGSEPKMIYPTHLESVMPDLSQIPITQEEFRKQYERKKLQKFRKSDGFEALSEFLKSRRSLG